MKFLVTGGAGFIGSNLVDQLVKLDHQVIVLDNLVTGRLSNLHKVKDKVNNINNSRISNNICNLRYFFLIFFLKSIR